MGEHWQVVVDDAKSFLSRKSIYDIRNDGDQARWDLSKAVVAADRRISDLEERLTSLEKRRRR